jgi:preprotein translocase subunit SecE
MIEFFGSLAAVAVFIFLLSLLQYGIDQGISYRTRHADKESNSADEPEENISKPYGGLVADAIHAYRRGRQTDERERAKRERATIVVLIITAIFAAAAATVAGVSAWIFQGQLDESARQTAIAQQSFIASTRPWLQVTIAPIEVAISRNVIAIANFAVVISNLGHSPALHVVVEPEVIADNFRIIMPDAKAGPACKPIRSRPSVDQMTDPLVIFPNGPFTKNLQYTFQPLAVPKGAFIFGISVCAYYVVDGLPAVRATGVVANLARKMGCDPETKLCGNMFDSGLSRTYPRNELEIVPDSVRVTAD